MEVENEGKRGRTKKYNRKGVKGKERDIDNTIKKIIENN